MGDAYKCDRCGSLNEGSSEGTLCYGQMPHEDFSGELCKACEIALKKWWQTSDAEVVTDE